MPLYPHKASCSQQKISRGSGQSVDRSRLLGVYEAYLAAATRRAIGLLTVLALVSLIPRLWKLTRVDALVRVLRLALAVVLHDGYPKCSPCRRFQ